MPLETFHADRLAARERFSLGTGPEPAAPQCPPLPAGVTTGEVTIDGPHGPIRLLTYRPAGPAEVALLWAHGGGFRHGTAEMPEGHWVSAELCARAGAFVVSVDYRLAVDGVRYPVPLDDVHAAWSWFSASSDRPARAAIGGASAGAALALATAVRAGRKPDALLLAYPFTHFPNPAADAELAAELSEALPPAARFTAAGVEDMVRNYVGRISDLPPDALPGAARLTGLPPARILLSEYDDLRTSGELLARQLTEAGVETTTYLAKGAPHGHLNQPADLPGTTGSLDYFAAALRELAGQSM
ncbi:alpha/beta hydrolase fold domain-containing protein [Paractinoplanes durhamensis]|uniref:Esterase n=1 Tax=Paractinoplanes durhamensis TaxID=113563 RepID=A0ABQ3ZBW7_9ACTN|nr:alpha/beta hydrolase [Actinoplanes durhamensis]GIE07323.1 esterase [Actinoplanes durhamensis]